MIEDNEAKSPRAARAAVHPRIATVLHIERTALGLRYAAYVAAVLYLSLFWVEPIPATRLLLATVALIVQNAFVHWVLHTRQYGWFLSPVNCFLHLGTMSVLVAILDGAASPAPLLYLILLLGYSLYTPRFAGTFLITVVACIAYTLALLVNWYFVGVSLDSAPVVIYFAAILCAGWILNMLGSMIRTMEVETQTRAQELASSEATLRAILDSTASPIVVCDEHEFIAHVNDRACEFLQAAREELISRRFRSFLFDDGTLPTKLASLRARGEYSGEALITTDDGEEHDVVLVARSFVRDNRRLFVVVLQDVTEQKHIQESSRLATLQLERVNEELQRLNQMRTAFLVTVSQRLRSPLTAVLGFVDLLLDEELGSLSHEQRRGLQSCRRSVLRVFELVEEAFDEESLRHVGEMPPEGPRVDEEARRVAGSSAGDSGQ